MRLNRPPKPRTGDAPEVWQAYGDYLGRELERNVDIQKRNARLQLRLAVGQAICVLAFGILLACRYLL